MLDHYLFSVTCLEVEDEILSEVPVTLFVDICVFAPGSYRN